MQYVIRVRGHLPENWEHWFGGMTMENLPDGESLLSGDLPDQSALFGVLMQIRDLGLPLLFVQERSLETGIMKSLGEDHDDND